MFGEGLDQPTPREWPWYVVIPFCVIVAPIIVGFTAIFAGLILGLVVHVVSS